MSLINLHNWFDPSIDAMPGLIFLPAAAIVFINIIRTAIDYFAANSCIMQTFTIYHASIDAVAGKTALNTNTGYHQNKYTCDRKENY